MSAEHFPELEIPVDDQDAVPAPDILVGPVLRYRGEDGDASVFVETSRACRVAVRAVDGGAVNAEMDTWSVHGHHYALVALEGLPDDRDVAYEVALDGVVAWPLPDSINPPSVIPALPAGGDWRVTFGSCREPGPYDEKGLKQWGADALVGLANDLRRNPRNSRPNLILHLGDQVYADDAPPQITDRLAELHADMPEEVRSEITNFEEYTWLYQTTWMHEDVRWLLSTVPNAMILDDHDLRDDWNTSISWRRDMEAKSWWRDRVVGGLASYWVYQHLGNLPPQALRDDPLYATVTGGDDAAATAALDEYAWNAYDQPDTAQWSFRRDLGHSRLVVIDARCSRVLDPPEKRSMLDEPEWQWVEDQVLAEPAPRHLLIASTLPVFLPHGVHHVESWNEAVATGAWGTRVKGPAEALRRKIDLEHWPAYHRSFIRLVDLLYALVRRPETPRSILVLSGDVHFSYTAPVWLRDETHDDTAIYQLVQSPMRNKLPPVMIGVFWLMHRTWAAWVTRKLARLAGVKGLPVSWRCTGPLTFTNGVMTLHLADGDAQVAVQRAIVDDGVEVLDSSIIQRLDPAPRD